MYEIFLKIPSHKNSVRRVAIIKFEYLLFIYESFMNVKYLYSIIATEFLP